MKKKRIILSAGGTGGHLFPAQATAQSLPEHEILFVAGGLDCNPFFDQSRFSFEEIAVATFSFTNPLQLVRGSRKILQGVLQSEKIIRTFSPDLIVGFGSYYTLPLLIAAKRNRIPIILHEQNAVAGKVNRLFSRFAHMTAVTFPVPLKGVTQQVLFPIRPQPEIDPWSYFGLEKGRPVLLVFGGSQGALGLNTLFLEALPMLKKFQILHFTGRKVSRIEKNYSGITHCVKPFEPNLQLAMQIADLAITRAGASTIAELTASQTPAILIPFPYATDNHQEMNAHHFVGGEVYLEKELTGERLAQRILDFPIEEKKMQLQYSRASCQLKHFSQIIEELLAHG